MRYSPPVIPSGSSTTACAATSPCASALRNATMARPEPARDRCAKPSILPSGPSYSRPLPSARKAWTSTPTATRSCTGTCRRTPSTSSSARAAFTLQGPRRSQERGDGARGYGPQRRFQGRVARPVRSRPGAGIEWRRARAILAVPAPGRRPNRAPRPGAAFKPRRSTTHSA